MFILFLGNYGAKGMEEFKNVAKDHGVCIATSEVVSSQGGTEQFDELVTALHKAEKASVVICFCEGRTVKRLLQATKRMFNDTGNFLIIGR